MKNQSAEKRSENPPCAKIINDAGKQDLRSEAEVLPGFIEELIARQAEKDFTGLDTGFPHLNRVINGLNSGLIIIGGGPGSGKTTIGLQISVQRAELNHVPVLYFSLDQAVEDLRIRTVSRMLNIENRDLFRGRLIPDGSDIQKLVGFLEGFKDTAEYIYLSGPDHEFSLEGAARGALFVMQEHEAKQCVIVFDYLQRIYPARRFGGDYERLNFVVGELSRLAAELASPVIAISEINRASYDKKSLQAFKDSGRIEYVADVACLLLEDPDSGKYPRRVSLHIVKNRNGERAEIKFNFWTNISRFEERQGPGFEEVESESKKPGPWSQYR